MKYLLVVLLSLMITSLSANPVQIDSTLTPREVHIGVVILDIANIDNLNETIETEFVLFLSWEDSTLVAPGQTLVRKIPLENARVPELQIRNARDFETFRKKEVEVYPNGTIMYRQRYAGDIKQKFNFREFPFDKQTWTMDIFHTGVQNIKLIPDDQYKGMYNPDWITIPDWRVNYVGQTVRELDEFDFPVRTMEIQYNLKRRSDFYIWKVVVPMLLVVLMSWSVFWIDPVNIGAQLTVSVTAILTLIAFQFSVAQLLPPLPYLTALDKFTIGTDFLVFLAFLETIITSFLIDKGHERPADRMDYLARFVFPVMFVLLVIFTLVVRV